NIIIGVVGFLAVTMFLMITLQGTEVFEAMRSLFVYFFEQIELRTFFVLLLEMISSNLVTIAIFLFVGSVIHSTFVQNQRGLKMFLGFVIVTIILNQFLFRFTGGQEFAFDLSINEQFMMNMESFNPLID